MKITAFLNGYKLVLIVILDGSTIVYRFGKTIHLYEHQTVETVLAPCRAKTLLPLIGC